MISVAGSGVVSMNFVVDESMPDGAVNRRSAGTSSVGGPASIVPVSSTAITSVGCSSTIGGGASSMTAPPRWVRRVGLRRLRLACGLLRAAVVRFVGRLRGGRFITLVGP